MRKLLGWLNGLMHFAWLAACLAGLAAPAHAIVSTTDAARTAGLGLSFLDGVARLDITSSAGSFGCSGSLLSGGAYVLTAAHCVSGESGTATTSNIVVSLLGGAVTVSTSSYVVNPGWNGTLGAGNDLALVRLAQPITAIAGYSLHLSSAQGSTVTLAGYGLTGNGTSGSVAGTFGTLYYGLNIYDGVNSAYTGTYLYDFDRSIGPSSTGAQEVLIAPGDSGGPGLIQVNGQWVVAGVHSFDSCFGRSCPVNGTFGEIAGDVALFEQAAWLQSVTAVPEPQAHALMLAGLVIIGVVTRRRTCRDAAIA